MVAGSRNGGLGSRVGGGAIGKYGVPRVTEVGMCETHQRVARRPAWKEKKSALGSKMEFPGGSDVKEIICNARDRVQSLGQEDPLEKGMTIYSSILAWKIP